MANDSPDTHEQDELTITEAIRLVVRAVIRWLGGDWLTWLAWGWVALLFLAALAEVTGWENLRLALDFERHIR